MKTKKRSLFIVVFSFLAAMSCLFAILSFSKTSTHAEETAPVSDAVVLINVDGESANVTLDTANPNSVTTEGIVWKTLSVSSYDAANAADCYANIGNENNLKVGLLIKFKNPVVATYFDDLSLKFFPGEAGTLYAYNSKTTDLTAENAKGSLAVTKLVANTLKLNTADFVDDNGKISEITLLLDRSVVGDWFFGKFTFSLKEEYIPTPEDFESAATEDPATSPISGAVDGSNANVNGIKDEFEFVSFEENKNGGYMSTECGYCTGNLGILSAIVFKLKTPITAADYTDVSLSFYPGLGGTVALYSSEAKMFNGVTAAATASVTQYKKCTITAKASDLANGEGKITNITLAVVDLNTSAGQLFFYGIDLKKADGSSDAINFLDKNGIVEPDITNINGVTLSPYNFINVKKQTWPDAGMGLCSSANFDKAGSAMVITFKEPINTALYEKIEFSFFSGMTGKLEIYSSTAKSLFSSSAVQTEEIKSQGKYTFTMNTADYADAEGMMNNFTLYAPEDSTTSGQIFFGTMKVTAKTPTSYLDELVLTEGGRKSMTLDDNAEFITENIPEATDNVGAFSDKTAVSVKGKTTFTFLKEMKQADTHFGNIKMRVYLPDDTDVTKIDFYSEGATSVTESFDVTGKKGWFDITLSVMDYLNAEGIIGSITVEADGNKQFIFGGAEVEDKLRLLNEKNTSADISELVPMSEDGVSFTSTEKVNYTPLFERKATTKNIVKFKMKISDIESDFNVMFEMAGVGKTTQGIWFWFDKGSVNMITNARTSSLPSAIKANEWFEVELGVIPYTVDFMPYGVKGYLKINGKTMIEANVDTTVQATGEWFGAYVHQTEVGTTVSIAPVDYVETALIELSTESGKNTMNIGDTDKIVITKNAEFDGQEISGITVVSGDSVKIDENGYITAEKKGTTVFKVTSSAIGCLKAEEFTISINVDKYYTVRIGGVSQQVAEGEKLVLPELSAPEEGYEFAGLYTDKECTQKFDYENTTITQDLTLYVGWKKSTGEKSGCSCGSAVDAMALSTALLVLGAVVLVVRKKGENK